MDLSEFKKLVELSIIGSKNIDSAMSLGIDLIEYNENSNRLISLLLRQILTPEGIDWYNWFMYEKGAIEDGIGREDIKAYSTENGIEVEIISNVDELFDYLKTNKYFKCDQK